MPTLNELLGKHAVEEATPETETGPAPSAEGPSLHDLLGKYGTDDTKTVKEAPEISMGAKAVNTASAIGEGVHDLPTQTKGYLANLYEGSRPLDQTNTADTWAKEAEETSKKRAQQPDAEAPTLIGTKGDWRNTVSNMPFSLGSMAGSIAGGAVGSLAGPIGTVAGRVAGAGLTAYRADSAMFMRNALDTFSQKMQHTEGRPPSRDELLAEQERLQPYAQRHGSWEAVPEAIGTPIATKLLGGVFKKDGKNLLAKGAKAIFGTAAEELPTETVTQMGQQRTESEAGLSKDAPRDFTSGADWGKSLEEVAVPVVQQSLLLGGGAAAARKGYDVVSNRLGQKPTDLPAPQEESTAAQKLPETTDFEGSAERTTLNPAIAAPPAPPAPPVVVGDTEEAAPATEPTTTPTLEISDEDRGRIAEFVDKWQSHLDAGGVPTVVSPNMRKAAQVAGVYDPKDAPNTMLEKLRDFVYPKSEVQKTTENLTETLDSAPTKGVLNRAAKTAVSNNLTPEQQQAAELDAVKVETNPADESEDVPNFPSETETGVVTPPMDPILNADGKPFSSSVLTKATIKQLEEDHPGYTFQPVGSGSVGYTILPTAKTQEQINAEQIDNTSAPNGNGSAQPTEGESLGNPAIRSDGVQPEGPENGNLEVSKRSEGSDRRVADTFTSHSNRRVAARRQLAREAGLQDEEALAKIVPEEPTDAVTGFSQAHDKDPTIVSAAEHVANTGEAAHFVEADISNLGGLNAHFGDNHSIVNPIFRQMSDIFAEEMRKAGKSAVLIRHGGDELSAVVIGGSDATIQRAMLSAKNRVADFAKHHGLDSIPHTKVDKKSGVGLYLGSSKILPGMSPEDVTRISSESLHAEKLGAKNVGRKATGPVGAEPSSEQPTDAGGSITKGYSGSQRVDAPIGSRLKRKPRKEETKTAAGIVKVNGIKVDTSTFTPEQIRAWQEADSQHQNAVSHADNIQSVGENPAHAEELRKAAGMELAAARRKISGNLTRKERIAEEAIKNKVRAGTFVVDSSGFTGTALGAPAFGKVKVLYPDGATKSVSRTELSITDQAPAITQNGNMPEAPVDAAAEQTELNKAAVSEKDIQNGSYEKVSVDYQGVRIPLENAAGSQRTGVDAQGHPWSVTMHDNYGEIEGTKGADGDKVDAFIKPGMSAEDVAKHNKVFIIDQVNPKTGIFDEHKVILGYDTTAQAKQAYLDNYSKGWQGLGAITLMRMDKFKEWLTNHAAHKVPTNARLLAAYEKQQARKATYNFEHHSIEAIQNLTRDLQPDQGDSRTYDADGNINGRLPSTNPEWFKNGAFVARNSDGKPYAKLPSVVEIWGAVASYKEGKNLTPYQIAILNGLAEELEFQEENQRPVSIDPEDVHIEEPSDYDGSIPFYTDEGYTKGESLDGPQFSRPDSLEHLFEKLSSRSPKATREAALASIATLPQAEKIQYVEDRFIDLLSELEESNMVDIKC